MRIYGGRYLREDDLRELGAGDVGRNVRIHESCVLIGLENMSFGDNIRIDAFTVISAAGGYFRLGDFIHISTHCFFAAGAGVEMDHFSAVSAGSLLFSRSDDYSGLHLTGPTVPQSYTRVDHAPIVLRRHALIGSGAVVLPGVELAEGATAGAQALVNRSLEPWTIYGGVPAKPLKPRLRNMLELEAHLRQAIAAGETVEPLASL